MAIIENGKQVAGGIYTTYHICDQAVTGDTRCQVLLPVASYPLQDGDEIPC